MLGSRQPSLIAHVSKAKPVYIKSIIPSLLEQVYVARLERLIHNISPPSFFPLPFSSFRLRPTFPTLFSFIA